MSVRGVHMGGGRSPSVLWLPAAALLLLAAQSRAQDGLEWLPEGRIDPARVAAALDQLSNSGSLDFCRRPSYRLTPREAALCGLAPAAQARCPAFAAACERAANGTPWQAEASSSEPGVWRAVLVWALRAAGVVLLAALAVACVRALLHLLRDRASSRPRERAEGAEGAATPVSSGPAGAEVNGGPERHLARARALAASGEHARALVELHLGVLSGLDTQGLVTARPGRTNGDYARELRQKPELLAAFREITAAVEVIQFGSGGLDASHFQRLLGRAASLLPVLLFGLLLALGAVGCGEERPKRTASGACGTGADGHSLLCDLLQATGASIQRRYRPLDMLADAEHRVDVVVLLRQELGESGARALEAWVRDGGGLVLTTPLAGIDQQLGVERSARACGPDAAVAGSERALATIGPALSAPRLVVDARCRSGDPFIARGALGDGWVSFVPTASVLSNASLAAGDNAALLVSLLFPRDAVIELVGDWTRDEPENPLGQVRAAGLLPWVVQLLALGLCYGLYRGTPFTRRRAPPDLGRRRFSEHAEALGQRWAEAGAAGTALTAYATWAAEQLRERLPSGTEQNVTALAQVISDKTGQPADAILRTLELARRAQRGPEKSSLPTAAKAPSREPPADEAAELSTLKSLARLLTEIGGPR